MKKRAASIYLKLLQKQPENVKLRLKLARLYEEIGMHEEAMKEYEIIKKLS
jgi:tetratricopeptide (TPR) repeat protein